MASVPRSRGLILLALFLSGAAGLMHEVVWAKLLASLTGSTAKSHAVVLSVFMGGLAIGAVLFGRRSDRRERPLYVYVWLEIAVGLYCLALPVITRAAGALYESLAAAAFEATAMKVPLRLSLSLVVVAIPAILMGGTLPVLARHLVREIAQTRKAVASLYALNNLGAVLGSGAAGFWLLPAFGIYGSLGAACALNFVAAVIVWLIARRATAEAQPATAHALEPAAVTYSASQYRAALWALALSGFAAMGYEVVFLRVIALGFGSSTHSFTVMLMCFITGIGIGSWIVSAARVTRPMWWLAASQLGAIASLSVFTPYFGGRLAYLVSTLRTRVLEPVPGGGPSELAEVAGGYVSFLAGQAGYCLAMLLLPTICIGFGFPLVAQIQARSVERIGGSVGSTYAWNTVGNVLGVVITSLFLMPALGIEHALHANLALNAVAFGLLFSAASDATARERLVAPVATAGVLTLYVLFGLGWSRTLTHAEGHLRLRQGPPPGAGPFARERHPAGSFEAWRQRFVRDADPKADGYQETYLDEDPDTNVLAVRKDRSVSLYINGKGDASTNSLDMVTFLLTGHIPMFLMPEAKDVMVIGHGSGVTTGAMLRHPIERVDVVEISEGVLGADALFAWANHACLSDPRTHVYLDDARTFLRTVPRKYDLIVSQPSNPWIAGIGNLFTVDFFRDCRDRLEDGGAMVVWFHHYESSDDAIRLIVRTVGHVFPSVECFLAVNGDVIALASMRPLSPDFARMEERFDQPEVRSDLARTAAFNLASVLAYHAIGPTRFREIAAGEGPLNTDDHQLLEYTGAYNMFLGRDASLLMTDAGFTARADGTSERLLDRYLAWRSAQGAPATRAELSAAADTMRAFVQTKNLSLAHLVEVAAAATEGGEPPTRPCRGADPPLESMIYAEALNRANFARVQGNLARAMELGRRALALEPASGGAILFVSNLHLAANEVAEAEAVLKEGLARGTKDTNVEMSLALIYLNTARPAEARAIYQKLVDYEENPAALMMLGNFVASEGRPDEALDLYERAVRRDGRNWQAAANLARLLGNRGEIQRALDVVDYALSLSPGVADLKAVRDRLAPGRAPSSKQGG
jgi:spermidine synthase/tetratricopeptide (TPR) repeat protein